MDEDGIDMLAKIEKLEKRIEVLEYRIGIVNIEKTDIIPICDHNCGRVETTAGEICARCGVLLVSPFNSVRDTTNLRIHL